MYQFKNELKVKDINNDENHTLKFDSIETLYSDELWFIDARELGYEIACDLQSQAEIYEWDEIENIDIEHEIKNYLLDLTDKLRERIQEVCEENEWPIEDING